ncbi:mRNA cap guanine-N7 methyltransferase [Strongyloides ratti]|uniref:mRNA (guanine-N(7))-methyltransferase n=1 Tax=Strongyloides ratti TaxID=34506 RepID=A0A090LE77_STRRB|nr:mRNA cap guanine-N7 methyltransferase [Strongyloides ratti]CEF65795.1 mRNA cap guanine-N7 methyltransferase [Strongyloides ratti]
MSSGFVKAGKTLENDNSDKEVVDSRPLFERLREAKEKAQEEKDKTDKLVNSLSVVTEEDDEFYDELNRKTYLLKKQKKDAEKDIINKIKIKEAKEQVGGINIDIPDDIDEEDEISEGKKVLTSMKMSSQAQLLGNILKRKSKDDSPIERKKVDSKIVDYESSVLFAIFLNKYLIINCHSKNFFGFFAPNCFGISIKINCVKEVGLNERDKSAIYYLRNFNNFIKSCLIQEFITKLKNDGNYNGQILDLCCGKGGDLLKWKKGFAKKVVMTDIAEISLEHCGNRYSELVAKQNPNFPLFDVEIIHADSTVTRLDEYIKEGKPFDICSCQFSLHYAFESERKARQMLQNATENIKEGGYFIGTIPNANLLISLLKKNKSIYFKNKVCNLSYLGVEGKNQTEEERLAAIMDSNIPLFGAKIDWQLDNLVNCPEYLVHIPLLVKMLEEFNMELVYCKRFDEAMYHFMETIPDAERLLEIIKALEKYPCRSYETQLHETFEYEAAEKAYKKQGSRSFFGTMSKCEWEVMSLYMTFAFRKKST